MYWILFLWKVCLIFVLVKTMPIWSAALTCRGSRWVRPSPSIRSPTSLVFSPSQQKIGLPTHVSPHDLISSTDKDQRLSQCLLVKWNNDCLSMLLSIQFTHLYYTDSSRLAGSFSILKIGQSTKDGATTHYSMAIPNRIRTKSLWIRPF